MQSRDGRPHFRNCEQSSLSVNGSAGTGNEAGRILDAGVLRSSVLFVNSRLTHSTTAGSAGSSGMLFTVPLPAIPSTVCTAYATGT